MAFGNWESNTTALLFSEPGPYTLTYSTKDGTQRSVDVITGPGSTPVHVTWDPDG